MLEKYLGFPSKTHHYIYVFTTILIAVSLPLSVFGLSLGIIILGSNWIVEGDLVKKIKILWGNKNLLFIISIYLTFVVGLIWTTNFKYAIHDLKIKLPLLGLPVIYGTISAFSWKKVRMVLIFFVLAVIAGSFISFAIFLGATGEEITDTRNISIFISHIRFALMIDLAILILFYGVFKFKTNLFQSILLIAGIAWLIFFLFILGSYTGLTILILVLPLALLYLAYQKSSKRIFNITLTSISLTTILIIFFSFHYIHRFNKQHLVSADQLELKTVNGNFYTHDTLKPDLENGYQVWIYVCEKELRKEWNEVSDYKYDSLDMKNQCVHSTLRRYLTSKGLRKDSLGFSKLTKHDIEQIEMGNANYIFGRRWSLYTKLYPLLWQWKRYRNSEDPNGQSVTMRIEYVKTGINVLKRHLLIGTGTGDLEDQFKKQYELDKTKLHPEYQKRSHNQILTIFITLGLLGGIWICFAFTMSIYIERKNIGFLFIVFLLIALLSMLNEDTLETHSGVSFIAFFFSFLLYNHSYRTSNDPD